MKSNSFKSSASVFRFFKETKKKKKRLNWDRIIYFIIIGGISFFGFRYVVNNSIYIKANGQVLFNKLDIKNLDDCRIIRFYKEEGDTVYQGDTLFVYINDNDDGNTFGNGAINYSVEKIDSDWSAKEQFKLKKEISLKRLEISQNNNRLDYLKNRLETMKNKIILDVSPRRGYEKYLEEITELQFDTRKLKTELSQLYYIESLLLQEKNKFPHQSISGFGLGGNEHGYKVYYSPVDSGVVTRIYKEPQEVALKSENIMSIHKPENIYIKAFFDQEDYKKLKEGDNVDIEFPDGTISSGTIKRFYFATFPLPVEFQKKYEPVNRSLTADILPVTMEELKVWRSFYKMGVVVYKSKLQ